MTRLPARRACAVVFAIIAGACGGTVPPVTLPPAAVEASADAVTAWDQATAPCRGAASYSAEVHLSGRVGAERRKVRGTLNAALTSANEIYLALNEPIGPAGFVLSGPGDHATLVIPRDKRVLVAPAADIVEALTGLRLEPRELMAVLTGCVAVGGQPASGSQAGDLRDVAIGSSRIWLQRGSEGWHAHAGTRPGLAIVYRKFAARWPSDIGLASTSGATTAFEFQVRTEQVVIDSPQVSAATFLPNPPAGATPITLDELRRMGPLGEKKH
jgi:hypothetical protein